jgi:hypothetical protein
LRSDGNHYEWSWAGGRKATIERTYRRQEVDEISLSFSRPTLLDEFFDTAVIIINPERPIAYAV